LDIDNPSDFEKFQQAHARGGIGSALLESADLTGRDVSAGPHLVLVGQEAVAKTLARLGRLMKFTVTVVDPFLTIDQASGAHRVVHSLDFSRLSLPADTFVVVASRGRFDEDAVEQAIDANAAYVALVANRKRADEIRRSLSGRGTDASRLRAPAGLDIGADGPEEIALSIMAEIIAERRRAHHTP
jgi:xanthine dehydrogenase accessory factor